jgi:hypothetical protein
VPPKTLGGVADALYRTRQKRLDKALEVEALREEERALEELALQFLNRANLTSGRGKLATVTKVPHAVPTVTDWAKLYAHIKKTNGFDLLQRRVSTSAYRERMDAKARVPGTKVEHFNKISCTKAPVKKGGG